MKKLKLSELNLDNAEVLTREQLKKVLGGQSSFPGGACVHENDWTGYQCGLTCADAINMYDGGAGGWDHYCCDSCESSWNQAHQQ